ncbi:MAG: BACON domain-containing protein [Alistipes sp.]|nr:BACON domain-containing protein [Alistipes sp.]
MNRLFTFIALAAMALVSCESKEAQGGGSNITPNQKIKLTSASVMSFGTAGGEGTITYTFEDVTAEAASRAASTIAEAATAVDWIDNLSSNEDHTVTFTVAPNSDSEDRSATIKVSYGESSFMVMVEQEGLEQADVNFTAKHLNGSYWGKYPTTKGFNYLIILGDHCSEHYLTKKSGATEYRFNIYSNVSSAFNTTHRVPVGTYRIDHTSSGNPGTIDAHKDQSYYLSATDADLPYQDATLIVTEESIIADIRFFNGETHRVEYYGSNEYEDYIEGTFADVYPVSQYTQDITFNVKSGRINLYYRGDHLGTGCDVWMAEMVAQISPYSGEYLIFDLLIPKGLGGTDNYDSIVGNYKFHDENTTSYEYTIPIGRLRDDCLQMHAWYLWCVQSQVDMSAAAPMTSGTVDVTKNAEQDYTFTINSTDDNGNRIIGTFQGTLLNVYDQCYE